MSFAWPYCCGDAVDFPAGFGAQAEVEQHVGPLQRRQRIDLLRDALGRGLQTREPGIALLDLAALGASQAVLVGGVLLATLSVPLSCSWARRP